MRGSSTRWTSLGAAWVIAGMSVIAQSGQPARPERGADLLSVDFVAVTAEGHPIADLRASEVTLRVGGRRRIIRSLQLISTADNTDLAASDLPPAFATNAGLVEGRAFSIVIDDDSFRSGIEGTLRESVDAFITRLTAADRLSLVTMPYGGVKVPFTTDHSRVRTALSRLVGQASGTETGSEMACRTGRTLESLLGYLDTQGIRDMPLTIMFVTGGLSAPRRDAPVMLAPGRCELKIELYQQVGEAAGAARANFYVIQPGDMMVKGQRRAENIAGVGYLGSDDPIEGIEHLAGVTGGKMLHLTNAGDGALGRVLRETAAHYRLSFEADRNDRSGRSQQLDIRLSRQDLQLRSRPHVTFPRPEVGRMSLNPSPRDMLGVTTIFRDLPLRASAYTAIDPGTNALRVITIAEPVEAGTKFTSLVAALFDRDGKVVSHWSATAAELEAATIVGAVPAEPGVYRLRVAAIDSTGRAGTADYDFEAEIVRTGPLRLSSVILGLSREGQFLPKLRFTNEPVAIGYLEMEGAAAGTPITAALELSRTMNGPALVTVPLAIEPRGPTRYVARGAVPLAALTPGDYIVRAVVGVQGHPQTRVVRTLRKDPVTTEK
jgi:VWFA-related protein